VQANPSQARAGAMNVDTDIPLDDRTKRHLMGNGGSRCGNLGWVLCWLSVYFMFIVLSFLFFEFFFRSPNLLH
jgi:hypothetical protein